MRKAAMRMAAAAVLAAMTALFAAAAFGAEAQHQKHLRLAAELLAEMAKQGDAEAFADSIKSSKAVAIFPAIVQAGLGIGGMGGGGVVLTRRPDGGWNGPSFARLTGGSFGLQIGVQQVGLVLCVVNENGIPFFTGGEAFKLGGDVSIAAGPLGRSAEAGTDTRAAASIYSYSMSKGAFAGLTLSGSAVNVNADANKAYWGEPTTAEEALKKPAKGPKVDPLLAELKKLDSKK